MDWWDSLTYHAGLARVSSYTRKLEVDIFNNTHLPDLLMTHTHLIQREAGSDGPHQTATQYAQSSTATGCSAQTTTTSRRPPKTPVGSGGPQKATSVPQPTPPQKPPPHLTRRQNGNGLGPPAGVGGGRFNITWSLSSGPT